MNKVECNEVLSIVKSIFKKAGIPLDLIWHFSNEFDRLREYCNENNIKCYNGATKIVFPELYDDIVIKIPITGNVHRWSHNPKDKTYERYECDDHIKREIEEYNDKIKGSPIEFLFIKNEYIGQLGALRIYIQAKTEAYENGVSSITESTYCCAEESDFYNVCGDSVETIAAFYTAYGVDEADEFFAIMDDMGIRDIHEGNIGYLNGDLVIYDYAGFYP